MREKGREDEKVTVLAVKEIFLSNERTWHGMMTNMTKYLTIFLIDLSTHGNRANDQARGVDVAQLPGLHLHLPFLRHPVFHQPFPRLLAVNPP